LRWNLLHLNNGPDRAEIFFYGITGSTTGAFTRINAEDTIALDNRLFRADAIPDAGMTLNAFLTDFIYHRYLSEKQVLDYHLSFPCQFNRPIVLRYQRRSVRAVSSPPEKTSPP
jgi:hypothetical protein